MDIVRRPSLLNEGEPLLLARSTIDTAVRFRAFSEESGVPSNALISSMLCSMPLPIYGDFGVDEHGRGRRRWAGTRPEIMWHPLMWLPPRLAGRYTLTDSTTGEQRLEDDDLWVIRVALELSVSGLYSAETGSWVDVLSTVGLDVEDEMDLARVEDWLRGEPDPLLDAIDLSHYLDLPEREWALETAVALRDDLESASWALIADDLIGMTEDALAPGSPLSHSDTLMVLRSVTGLGDTLLWQVPDQTESGVSTGAESGEGHEDFFTRLHDLIDLDTVQPAVDVAQTHLREVSNRLYAIREAFWPHLDALRNIDESGEQAPATAAV